MSHFGAPSVLLALLAVVALAGGFVWLARWQRHARRDFAGPQAGRDAASVSSRAVLVLLAATLLVIAAARPQWGSHEFSRQQQGIDLMVALDVSQSMTATDATPSRLGLAQTEIARLVAARRGDRVGLILFAGSAMLRSPLTTDTGALVQLVQRADREAGLVRPGSDLGAALDTATASLAGSDAPGKALLIVSDGEDLVGSYADKLQALHGKGVVVYTAGVGTAQGAPLFDIDTRGNPRPKLDAQGQQVVSHLDEASLQTLASSGGGRYLHLGGSTSLTSLGGDFAQLQQTPQADETQRIPIERFQWFAGAALALLALAWLLPERRLLPRLSLPRPRLRPSLALVLVALLAGACGRGDTLRSDNGKANDLYLAGNYNGALAAYERLLAQRPDVPELSYNAGNALDRLGDYERAISETSRALPPASQKLGALTYYALGNHYFAANQLPQAYDAYRRALLLDPTDADAKVNLELTLLRLAAQQPPPTPQAPPGDQQPDANATPPPDTQPGPPQPGAPSANASPAPNGSPSPNATPSAADVQRSLQDALRGIDQNPTFDDATRILDLLRQEQESQSAGGAPNTPVGPDY